MADSDKVFSGSIPEIYDAYLVPLIFDSYARDIADRAVALAPQSVLETATGSGVVTSALSPRLASDAYYVATASTSRCSIMPVMRKERMSELHGGRPTPRIYRSMTGHLMLSFASPA